MRRRPPLSLRRVVSGLLALTVLAIGCGRSSTEPVRTSRIASAAASVAQVAAAFTGQEAPIADEQLDGKHLGFDTHTDPGERTMRAWRQAPGAPYRWVGYDLPSPCHRDASWTGKRQLLADMGWGLAAIYVGQQTRAAPPSPSRPGRPRRSSGRAPRATPVSSPPIAARSTGRTPSPRPRGRGSLHAPWFFSTSSGWRRCRR